jgi:hypothetical protein
MLLMRPEDASVRLRVADLWERFLGLKKFTSVEYLTLGAMMRAVQLRKISGFEGLVARKSDHALTPPVCVHEAGSRADPPPREGGLGGVTDRARHGCHRPPVSGRVASCAGSKSF